MRESAGGSSSPGLRPSASGAAGLGRLPGGRSTRSTRDFVPSSVGELAIVLHSHMPYVEGFGTWPFGEEWLFEATATSYLPLIELFQGWAAEGRKQVVTVGVTPVLADQLALAEVGERFLSFMRGVRVEAHRLDTAGLESAGQADAAGALRRSASNY